MSRKLKTLAVLSAIWIVLITSGVVTGDSIGSSRWKNDVVMLVLLPLVGIWGLVWIFRKNKKG